MPVPKFKAVNTAAKQGDHDEMLALMLLTEVGGIDSAALIRTKPKSALVEWPLGIMGSVVTEAKSQANRYSGFRPR